MKPFVLANFYGILLIGGGIAGFAKAGSLESLVVGVLAGAISHICAYKMLKELNLSKYEKTKTYPYIMLGLSGCLTVVMGVRYYFTQKPMPSLIVAALSTIALLYYSFYLATLTDYFVPIPKKRR